MANKLSSATALETRRLPKGKVQAANTVACVPPNDPFVLWWLPNMFDVYPNLTETEEDGTVNQGVILPQLERFPIAYGINGLNSEHSIAEVIEKFSRRPCLNGTAFRTFVQNHDFANLPGYEDGFMDFIDTRFIDGSQNVTGRYHLCKWEKVLSGSPIVRKDETEYQRAVNYLMEQGTISMPSPDHVLARKIQIETIYSANYAKNPNSNSCRSHRIKLTVLDRYLGIPDSPYAEHKPEPKPTPKKGTRK